ncbi:DUF6851 domain-containing protein [Roseovarius sp. 217]|jgi:Ca2+-binding RTX toxin-like protein|uniref:DUF6851 domain-containing protein n=1 Tax=Roseovarius sp. (strain 217) TaxID=314264 RepID=UPI0000685D51|nr:phosphatase PAP2 family protein [Roseovarius sp. 217]EAQ26302.1 hypothetical protein ROS217_14036 [Roseovarius sp. 217]
MENIEQSVVAQWNELQLQVIREGGPAPTPTTYQLHIVSAAVYDAYAALSPSASGHYSEIATSLANTEENKAEAVSFAAYTALVALYPERTADFDALMQDLGYDPATASTDPETPAGLGTLAAQNVFTARETDGSNAENGFADTTGFVPVNEADPTSDRAPGGENFDPNLWQPLREANGTLTDVNGIPIFDNDDPSTFKDQVALTPHWGGVEGFALTSGDQFRPAPPPLLGDFSEYTDGLGNVTTGDQAYRDQIAQVLEISANLTDEQKVIAEYWANGPRGETPPGHWFQIAQDLALREGHGIDQDAEMFFALSTAILDAGIATWEAKYTYTYIRPYSAIRDLFFDQEIQAWGGPNQGTQTILGQNWLPYQNVTAPTPPFPEFVSGHSTFSMAAARTLSAYLGSDTYYDGTSLSNYDLDGVEGVDVIGEFVTSDLAFEDFVAGGDPVVLRWETLTEAAQEAGMSRIFGGIHIQDGNLRGLEVGENVAANAEVRWSALFSNGGSDFTTLSDDGALALEGAGNDSVVGGAGDDTIEGGAGDDVLAASDGNDSVLGGDGNDRIGGGLGNDTIDGGTGDDVIGAGQGDDIAAGGDGNDVVSGGAGSDTLGGGADNDSISGSFGNDSIDGGDGDDLIGGGTGQDTILGGAGNDQVGAGEGDDDLFGGDGDDFLAGGGRDDLIDGGAGNDTINGGAGNDVMTGGDGVELFVFNEFVAGDVDVITDFEVGVDSVLIRVNDLDNGGNGLQGFFDALGIVDTFAGAQFNVNGNDVLLESVLAADLTIDSFSFL